MFKLHNYKIYNNLSFRAYNYYIRKLFKSFFNPIDTYTLEQLIGVYADQFVHTT